MIIPIQVCWLLYENIFKINSYLLGYTCASNRRVSNIKYR